MGYLKRIGRAHRVRHHSSIEAEDIEGHIEHFEDKRENHFGDLGDERCHHMLELFLVPPNEHGESEYKQGAGAGTSSEHDDGVHLSFLPNGYCPLKKDALRNDVLHPAFPAVGKPDAKPVHP